MEGITFSIIAGILIVFAAMAVIGVISARKIKNSEDFVIAGKKASPVMVAGAILCAIVGSGGTIGTAQTAFTYGIVGWWQTLGLAIGCFILGLCLSQAIYKITQAQTVSQVLKHTYGPKILPITAIFGSIAIFFSILSQSKGFIPLLTSIMNVSDVSAAIVCFVLVCVFVIFGGIFANSLGGLLKMGVIYVGVLLSAIIALVDTKGVSGITNALGSNVWNMFARSTGENGALYDIGIGVGFILGVLVTQTYVQAVLSAKDAKAARNGCMLGGALCLPVGLLCCIIGMYMKMNYPDISAAQALPLFMVYNYPGLIAGVFIGGLMLAALTSNAGLSLSVATLLQRDVICRNRPDMDQKKQMLILRVLIVIIVALSCVFSVSTVGTYIQTFIFLSYGMRTTVFLVPMLAAFFWRGKITRSAGMAAALAGPIMDIIAYFVMGKSGTHVFWGLGASLIAFIVVDILAKDRVEAGTLYAKKE